MADIRATIDAVVEEMRGWLLDCESLDMKREEIEEMTARAIVRATRQHFHGGVRGFVLADPSIALADVDTVTAAVLLQEYEL